MHIDVVYSFCSFTYLVLFYLDENLDLHIHYPRKKKQCKWLLTVLKILTVFWEEISTHSSFTGAQNNRISTVLWEKTSTHSVFTCAKTTAFLRIVGHNFCTRNFHMQALWKTDREENNRKNNLQKKTNSNNKGVLTAVFEVVDFDQWLLFGSQPGWRFHYWHT